MPLPMNDTNPEAESVLISLARKAPIAQRTARMRSLSQTTMKLSRRAIMRANPGYSDREVSLEFVKLHYGNDLASRLKNHLDHKKT